MESKKEILDAMGGIPEQVYDAIVNSFYDEARERIAGIRQAMASTDLQGIVQGAHAIKGASANLRLTQIHETAKALELAAKASNLPEVAKWQAQLVSLIP